jgi:glutathione peroxidase
MNSLVLRFVYTGQFEGLEALYQQYKDRGLVVVGFVNFGVTFTMIAPTPVAGEQANPVFREINRQSEQPRWNFTKYVIDRSGQVVERFPSKVRPDDPQLIGAIETVL